MVVAGVALVALGALAEVLGGTYFRRFFDLSYPPASFRHDDIRIKVHLSRAGLVLGVFLAAIGGLVALTR